MNSLRIIVRRVLRLFVPRAATFLIRAVAVLLLSGATYAQAQNAFDFFNAVMRAAVIEKIRAEWGKVPQNELDCLEQRLQQQGDSRLNLIERGITPGDPRLSSLRSGCRTATAPSPPVKSATLPGPEKEGVARKDLSAKPTFDCTKAISPTARILCLDQDGAKADWGLSSAFWARKFSLAESARDGFTQAHENWFPSLSRACGLQVGQSNFTPGQRQCVLNGFRRRAELFRSQLKGDALAESGLSPEQHAEIQQALIAGGHLDGDADGEFGPITRTAIKRFQAQSGFPEGEFLTAQQRQALEGAPSEPSMPRPPVAPTKPPVETAKLKEARHFLEDAQKFIAGQKTVPSISAIASEAANLQISLNIFDETAATQSMKNLRDLLKPINGFEKFVEERQAERRREDARQLAEARNEGAKNIYFIDTYLKEHLGDPKTTSLMGLKQQIDESSKKQITDEINKANKALTSYVKEKGLLNSYLAIVRTFPPAPPAVPAPIENGAEDDIVLFYNASSTAPKVWKNVEGKIVFQGESASLCFSQSAPDVALLRYVERRLREQGARNVLSGPQPCDLSKAGSLIDIIAFQRGGLRKEGDDYKQTLNNLIEDATFREYEIITNYFETIGRRKELSREIESDVEKGAREGYGVIAVNELRTVCVIAPSEAQQILGLKALLERARDLIAPKLTSDWQFEEKTDANGSFFALQRRQCGYVAGESNALRTLRDALRREQLKYSFSPVWFSKQDLEKTTSYVLNKPVIKTPIDPAPSKPIFVPAPDVVVRARGLMSGISELVKNLAEKRAVDKDRHFASYSDWLSRRFADQWETSNVTFEVADFGTVQWKGRPLDAIIVKSAIIQRNRPLGKNESICFFFGLVDDVEFAMQRDLISVACDSGDRAIKAWRVGKNFQSQWNAD